MSRMPDDIARRGAIAGTRNKTLRFQSVKHYKHVWFQLSPLAVKYTRQSNASAPKLLPT